MGKVSPKGHLEIVKLYDDGTEEVHFSEKNAIVSGMGVGLSHLFAGSGGGTTTDFQILNFQVGVSGQAAIASYGYSTNHLQLALTKGQYDSAGSELLVENLKPLVGSTVGPERSLARIAYSNIQRITPTSVRFNLVLDKYTSNDVGAKINEVGLFMRNPRGDSPHHPILVAYRPFTGLLKTSTFSLIFKWTLTF